ncbi:hypothetical protein GQQ23_21190 (plasmid) [Pantoea agglomerans]|nr:hypothetical protein [Pantoea agglomerans]
MPKHNVIIPGNRKGDYAMYRCPKCGASARTRNSEYLDKKVSPIISATIFTAGSPSAR